MDSSASRNQDAGMISRIHIESIDAILVDLPTIRVHKLAVREVPHSGKPEELLAKYGIDAAAIVKAVKALARNLGRQLSGRRFSGRLPSRATDFLLEFVDAQNKPCVVAWTTGREHAVRVEGQGTVRLAQSPQYLKCRLQGPE